MLSKNQLKDIQSLHHKKFRDNQRLFLVEGIKSVNEVLMQQPSLIKALFCTEDYMKQYSGLFMDKGLSTHEVSDIELYKISTLTAPNKALAVCTYFDKATINFDFSKNFSFYLDDIRDPGNFGTLIRLADWFGISTVFCSEHSCDFYNPKVVQASMGAFLRVKVDYINLNELNQSKQIDSIYGAVLNGKNLYEQNLQNGLIVIGNEANGISEVNLKHITKPITIPSASHSKAESLNAAIAASIIVSEFYRQLVLR